MTSPNPTANIWLKSVPMWLRQLLVSREKWAGINWEKADYGEIKDKRVRVPNIEMAEAITSLGLLGDAHFIMLDLDVPAALIPSSTQGHSHLYIARTVTWEKYRKLLLALHDCGVIEEGYLRASLTQQRTFLRLPWVKKGRERATIEMSPEGLDVWLDARLNPDDLDKED